MRTESDFSRAGWMRVWSVAALALLIGVALTSPAAAQTGKAMPPQPKYEAQPGQTAGALFKAVNTSTLKVLPVADFMDAMGVMTAALGFDCSDCHPGAGSDKVNWVFDTQRKITARKMVEMVAVINRNNFGSQGRVTCWTCHHGREVPGTTIALDKLYGAPNDEKDDVVLQAPGEASATQVLDKYVQALGGAQKLAGLKSFVATGKQGGYARTRGGGKFEIYAKTPDQRAVIVSFPDAPERGDQSRVYDGKIGWVNTPRSVLGEYQVTGSELDRLKAEAQLSFPGQFKTALTNLRTGYSDTINDRDVQVVQGNGTNGVLVTGYFDSKTGLLTRMIIFTPTPAGNASTQVDYDDYRDVGGIKFPFKFTFSWLDGRDAFELTDVKVNVPIETARFGKPRAGTRN